MMHSTNVSLFAGIYLWATRFNGMRFGSDFFRFIFTGKTHSLPVAGNSEGIQVTSDCGKYTTKLYLLPKHPSPETPSWYRHKKSSSKHRVYVICPLCGKRVWAGRINQHKCKAGI